MSSNSLCEYSSPLCGGPVFLINRTTIIVPGRDTSAAYQARFAEPLLLSVLEWCFKEEKEKTG